MLSVAPLLTLRVLFEHGVGVLHAVVPLAALLHALSMAVTDVRRLGPVFHWVLAVLTRWQLGGLAGRALAPVILSKRSGHHHRGARCHELK
jgi:hypothetical protein